MRGLQWEKGLTRKLSLIPGICFDRFACNCNRDKYCKSSLLHNVFTQDEVVIVLRYKIWGHLILCLEEARVMICQLQIQ